jgi:hypothetical protein
MTRKTDYLFQRPGSSNWWIKLQSPGKRVEKSLGTRDKKEAEIMALPLIARHEAALLAARPRMETVWHTDFDSVNRRSEPSRPSQSRPSFFEFSVSQCLRKIRSLPRQSNGSSLSEPFPLCLSKSGNRGCDQ